MDTLSVEEPTQTAFDLVKSAGERHLIVLDGKAVGYVSRSRPGTRYAQLHLDGLPIESVTLARLETDRGREQLEAMVRSRLA